MQINEELISQIVHEFYKRAREDDLIGEIFNTHVKDWERHLKIIEDFWSSILLTSGRYKGTPMAVHMQLGELTEEHFKRWLKLFAKTCFDLTTPENAYQFISRAERIAASLEMGVNLKNPLRK